MSRPRRLLRAGNSRVRRPIWRRPGKLDRAGAFMGWGVAMEIRVETTVRLAFCAIALAAGLLVAPARAETTPQNVVKSFYDVLLGVMKESKQLGFSGRYQRLKPAIEEAYNLALMSRLAIGPQWQSMTSEQQAKLGVAFTEFTVATYANRFDDYSGETFEVLPETSPSNGGVIVRTRLIKSSGEPVTLNYLMRDSGGKWQIIDVFLSGTISELATRRSEFTSILRRDGPQGLLQVLAKRVADLRAS
jgi:phospholipid transport system substrate-binding protein